MRHRRPARSHPEAVLPRLHVRTALLLLLAGSLVQHAGGSLVWEEGGRLIHRSEVLLMSGRAAQWAVKIMRVLRSS